MSLSKVADLMRSADAAIAHSRRLRGVTRARLAALSRSLRQCVATDAYLVETIGEARRLLGAKLGEL